MPARRGPLPLARLVQVRDSQVVYGCSTVDLNGRVADRAVFGALDWPVGTRLEIRESGGLIVVCADEQGVFRVTGRDRLLIPAAARQWCRLSPGDRVLLAGDPVGRRLSSIRQRCWMCWSSSPQRRVRR